MSEQDNVQLVKQGYDAFQRGDIQRLLQLFADDIEWTLDKVEQIPFSGKRRGKEQVAEFFKLLDENMHALQFEPQQFIAQGDKVVVLGHYVWSVKSTDRRIDSDWAHVFTVQNGKVAGMREYTDTAASAAAFREPGPDVAI
ncbi:MAG TPA: nuclear transport factor 2 family protein [Noviherbaspirillum sp.]|nr:nuclear transport factor 2 family protein [Noviherbaspirillum sp.]